MYTVTTITTRMKNKQLLFIILITIIIRLNLYLWLDIHPSSVTVYILFYFDSKVVKT